MNVEMIEMNTEAAKEKLESYRRKLKSLRHKQLSADIEREYEAAIKGYRALAKGTPLIDIGEVFLRCPFDAEGYPKLAIARADRKMVEHWCRGGEWRFFCGKQGAWGARGSLNISVPAAPGAKEIRTVYAQIPLVPADKRPDAHLKNYHILWEVEQWHKRKSDLVPDRDPYLLKHLHGSLYAVIAEWDLTDLEMAIMKGAVNGD